MLAGFVLLVNVVGGQQVASQLNQDVHLRALRDGTDTTGGNYTYAAEAGLLERVYADLGFQMSWVRERTEVTSLVDALGTLLMMFGGPFELRWFAQLP